MDGQSGSASIHEPDATMPTDQNHPQSGGFRYLLSLPGKLFRSALLLLKQPYILDHFLEDSARRQELALQRANNQAQTLLRLSEQISALAKVHEESSDPKQDLALEALTDVVESLSDVSMKLDLYGKQQVAQWSQNQDLTLDKLADQTHNLDVVRRDIERLGSDTAALFAKVDSHYTAPRPITLKESGPDIVSVEVRLLAHLSPWLTEKSAIDVGAHIGGMSLPLLDCGLDVYAFEPYPPSYDKLVERLEGRSGFHAHALAIGSEDGLSDIHIAQTTDQSLPQTDANLFHTLHPHPAENVLTFSKTLPVEVRSLKSLADSEEIPRTAGIIKIDTEGYDLKVIEGMGSCTSDILLTEFWQEGHVFYDPGNFNKIEPLVREMKDRGFPLYIILAREGGEWEGTYHCNMAYAPKASWGNIVFFKRPQLFAEALRWCATTLEPTMPKA